MNRISHKRLAANRHHNLSVQTASQAQPPHHNTSKLKKLVSHKEIETDKRRQSKLGRKNFSKTKNVLQTNKPALGSHQTAPQRGRSSRRKHRSKSKSKSKSQSRSKSRSKTRSKSRSQEKRDYSHSGSSKHLGSRSQNRSASENYRNLGPGDPTAPHYSFDILGGD